MEHEVSQDESKPAAILNNKPLAKPSAVPHKKPSAIPAAIPHKKPSAIPQEELKNSDDIAEDEKKPVAIQQEEMKTTPVTAQPIQYSIPFIPPIAGPNMKVGTWMYEFCDTTCWHQYESGNLDI